jgi:hypothetical protein
MRLADESQQVDLAALTRCWISWFRAYRAIEWYESELSTAIAGAVTDPFEKYLKPDSTIKARKFFRPAALLALRDAVLTIMFEPAASICAGR